MPSGFKFVIGTMIILFMILIWIGTFEIFGAPGGIVDSFNNVTTDQDIINHNETARQVMYYSILFIIIVIFIWILKEERGVIGPE